MTAQGSFLYFVPGKKKDGITQDVLASNPILASPFFDLIHSPRLFNTKLMGTDVLGVGPGGTSGCIIAPQPQVDVNQQVGFYPDKQEWRQFGDVWIGWEATMLPGPESLRRGSLISGYEVELGDGRIWLAPTIRSFAENTWQCRLPCEFAMNEQMEWGSRPAERFRELWDMSGRILNYCFNDGDHEPLESIEWFVKCLSTNYRVGAPETSILRLMNSESITNVIEAAVDGPLVESFLEQTVEAPQNPM